MKNGTVLYITDAASLSDELDEHQMVESLGLDPDWTMVAASMNGYYALEDATLMLIQKGASRIEAVKTAMGDDGLPQLFGEPMRVFG